MYAELIDAFGMEYKRRSVLIEAMWHTFDVRYYKQSWGLCRISSRFIVTELDLFPFVALLFWSMVKQMVSPIRVGDSVAVLSMGLIAPGRGILTPTGEYCV
jgi:hypothetical protein